MRPNSANRPGPPRNRTRWPSRKRRDSRDKGPPLPGARNRAPRGAAGHAGRGCGGLAGPAGEPAGRGRPSVGNGRFLRRSRPHQQRRRSRLPCLGVRACGIGSGHRNLLCQLVDRGVAHRLGLEVRLYPGGYLGIAALASEPAATHAASCDVVADLSLGHHVLELCQRGVGIAAVPATERDHVGVRGELKACGLGGTGDDRRPLRGGGFQQGGQSGVGRSLETGPPA